MRVLSVLSVFATILLVACSKGKFSTRPSLKLKNVSSTTVPVGGSLDFTFEFTDKEGDISNILYIKKIRTNQRVVATKPDSLEFQVPAFPKKIYGELDVNLDYYNHLQAALTPPQSGTPPKSESDTLIFKFVLKDKADNKSDTLTTDKIIILR